jgi:hypothetical protein
MLEHIAIGPNRDCRLALTSHSPTEQMVHVDSTPSFGIAVDRQRLRVQSDAMLA